MTAVAPLPFRPQAVLFDMDGLMLDSERAILDCLAQASAEQGHDLPYSLWLQMVGGSEAVCRALLHEYLDAGQAQALLDRAHALYEVVVDAGVPHRPGIVELLDWLQGQGIPCAVATSTKRPLALRKLRAAGLLHRFDVVCTSSDVAHPKPAPDICLLAASTLGVAPALCLVLEDSPTGVRAALAAGMTPVQVPDMLHPDEEVRGLRHRIVASLGEAQRLLEARLATADPA